jgi:hypothetical protein
MIFNENLHIDALFLCAKVRVISGTVLEMEASPGGQKRMFRYKTGVDKSKAAKLFIDSYYKDLQEGVGDRRKR